MPAGNIGHITEVVSPEQFAAISFSSSGDNILVAAVAGFQIRILSYNLVCAGQTALTWKSSVAGAISGPKSFLSNSGISVAYSPKGHIQTAVGEGLVLNSSQAVSVGGELTYILV